MFLTAWMNKAIALNPGEVIYLKVNTKKEGTEMCRLLRERKSAMLLAKPELATSIIIGPILKDGVNYVYLKKVVSAPLIGLKRGADGEMSKIDIQSDVDRNRRIQLMIRDGLTKDEINDNMEGLSPDEIKLYFGEEDDQEQG